ncbi:MULTISPECIES: malate synthase G [unclassified Devosia]|uniref:malate synthase G n=1 Tax=unclassified Devosia TaxID=196773 RepID=UPI00145C4A5B|nr:MULTISPECIES: malate synthase G [unclassified Devosia]MBJ6987529.1 malate synthase G [Devosia sp. MC521]QMW61887.1 malate synthase G [Devosia sp. MC521]
MTEYVTKSGLSVHPLLVDFLEKAALPGLPVSVDAFWAGFAALLAEHVPVNAQFLAKRDQLQSRIDDWHHQNGPVANNPEGYEQFLREIGYLVDEPGDFSISTSNLDPEISSLCGPQLVVPVSNARYALNAANARWGSLYDALYGTDVISRDGDLAPGKAFNAARGAAVVARAAEFLDASFPLTSGSHTSVTQYSVVEQSGVATLLIKTAAGDVSLADADAFVGYSGVGDKQEIVLKHHGLHAILLIDKSSMIGATHAAGLADVIVESALTTIQDCEDSVAAVDAEDKVGVYANWLGLMQGNLEDTFDKGGKTVTRRLKADRVYRGVNGEELVLKGRSLLLVRNVGHLMTTDAVLLNGKPVGEGLMDAAITALCAMHDQGNNSATGSIYIVKPKMHGPEEVAFACRIFASVEGFLGLAPNTIKIGIMDEERRTSANLKAAIYEARERVFFINTGFLDRTGDEIHTSMEAGAVLRKDEIKSERWISSYEDRNVLIGLACGLSGKAQIGKGMWARPDDMAAMMDAKIGHPNAGANTAWVPSPTAATLHALHYHQVDVFEAQRRRHNQAMPGLSELFSMPIQKPYSLSREEIIRELENNAQGILGYVVRWVQQGVGCSKVPDINNVGLMEDRATCRISSQAVANWLRHGLVSRDEVTSVFERMAQVVDDQNQGDPLYRPMSGNFQSISFVAALDLALHGADQPSGYTEPLLHAARRKVKARDAK